MIDARFDLPPGRAVAFFRRKGLDTSFAWQDMLHTEHDAAFTVAKMMDLDLLRDTRAAVDKAIAEGESFEQFKARLKPRLQAAGWWGRREMTDPLTGEVREVQLGSPRRLRTIYQTNLRTAYAAGHWSRIVDHAEQAPYLLYDAIDDTRTRPEHAAWDGTVLPVGDAWWQSHYPPNGWRCRCTVVQLTERQLQRLGKSGPDTPPGGGSREWTNPRTGEIMQVPRGIDPGWAYHPGRARAEQLRQAMADKAQAAGPQLGAPAAAAVERARPPTLDEAVEEGRRRLDAFTDGGRDMAGARQRLLQALRAERGTSRARLANRGTGAKLVADASERYPASWVATADNLGPLRARGDKKRGWHFTVFEPPGRPVRLPGFGRVQPEAGAGYVVAGNLPTATHEYAHRLQHAIPDLDDYFQQLHVRRTGDAPTKTLRSLTGMRYPPSELAQEDQYVDAYVGKVSSGRMSYLGRAGALEVMPMALERLLGGSLKEFQRWVEGDPELMALATGLLFRYEP